MNSLNWDDVRFFLAAARAGSLAGASRVLGGHQPTIGRRITSLEEHLGFKLFQRHAQGLILTEEGLGLLAAAEAMEEGAAALLRACGAKGGEIGGRVRVAAPGGLAVHLLSPALPSLHRRHPRLDVQLQASAASADLARGEADIAVRLYQPQSPDLVVRRVGVLNFGIYGAETYLRQAGIPTDEVGLQRHCFIGYGDELRGMEENLWLEALAGEARFLLRSDDTHTRLAATNAGLGLALLPHILAAGLWRVLPELEVPSKHIWLAMHQDLRHLARVRAVADWLAEILGILA